MSLNLSNKTLLFALLKNDVEAFNKHRKEHPEQPMDFCGSTHCRAGWVVTLAGKPGRDLEKEIGTGAAAALIYMASDPDLEQIPNWVASNEDALADIQAMAAK